MALTDDCDLYVSVHDAGVNRIVRHFFRQRPSLFNYGSPAVVRNPGFLCKEPDVHPVVRERGNPIVSSGPVLPVLGTSNPEYAVEYSLQITRADLDFAPGDAITLPPQLTPLPDQEFAVAAGACVGFGCPGKNIVDLLPPGVATKFEKERLLDRFAVVDRFDPPDRLQPPKGTRPDRGPSYVPTRSFLCTCLDVFATGAVDFVGAVGDQRIAAELTGLEIVDLEPTSLEDTIECYASLVLKLGVLPRLRVPVIKLTSDLLGLASISIEPTPNSTDVPNNPAIEDNQLKVMLDLATGPPLGGDDDSGGSNGGGGGSPAPPSFPGTPRARTRTGTFDLEAAVSERAVRDLFGVIRDGFTFSDFVDDDSGTFQIDAAIDLHLENGSIDLRNDGSISLSELDIVFDTLMVCLGIDIDEICVGGFCIIPNPFGGCAVRAPEVCIFSDNPDINFCLDIGGLVRSEISARLAPVVKYSVNPGRTAAMNDWDAFDVGVPNHWQLYVDPITVDVDLFDIADMVGDLLEDAVDAAIDTLLGPLPGWAKDLIRALMGPVIDVVRAVLDFGDDFSEWLSDQLGVSLGLFNLLITAVLDYLTADAPLLEFEDPLKALDADGGLIPVLIPVEFLGVDVDGTELKLQVDIGS